ncbi:MAG: hypothetical protein ACR2P1_01935 [Pseudomonadales bacterium]
MPDVDCDALADEIEQTKAEKAAIEAKGEQFDKDNAGLIREIDELDSKLNPPEDDSDGDSDDAESELDKAIERSRELPGEIRKAAKKLEREKSTRARLESRHAVAMGERTEVTDEMWVNAGHMGANEDEQSSLGCDGGTNEIYGAICESLRAEHDQLQSDQDELQQRLNRVDERLLELDDQIDDAIEAADAARQEIEDLEKELEDVTDRITEQEKEQRVDRKRLKDLQQELKDREERDFPEGKSYDKVFKKLAALTKKYKSHCVADDSDTGTAPP